MTSRALLTIVACAAVSAASCGSNEALPHVAKRQAEEVTLAQLLSSPEKFNESVVRVIAPCTIAVERNALHLSEDDLKPLAPNQNGDAGHAIWLDLGWPISPEVRALHNKYALVEGQFDSGNRGHMGQYAGAIKNITRIEGSSAEAELKVRRRVAGSR